MLPIKFKKKQENIKEGKNIVGEINYRLYEDNIVVFMGSFIDENYRNQGIFSKLLEKILNNLEKNTTIYVPLSGMGQNMLDLFERNGFEITKEPLRYWGELENTINVKKII